MVLITAQLLLLAWLLLFLIVADAAEARGPEVALAKMRGRGRWRSLTFSLGEPVILLAVALPGRACWPAGRSPPGSGTSCCVRARRSGCPRTSWLAAAVATVGGLAAVAATRAADAEPVGGRPVAAGRPPGGAAGLGPGCHPHHRRRGRPHRAAGQRPDRLGPARCARPAAARAARRRGRGGRLPAADRGLPGRIPGHRAAAAGSGRSSPCGTSPAGPAGCAPRSCSPPRSPWPDSPPGSGR